MQLTRSMKFATHSKQKGRVPHSVQVPAEGPEGRGKVRGEAVRPELALRLPKLAREGIVIAGSGKPCPNNAHEREPAARGDLGWPPSIQSSSLSTCLPHRPHKPSSAGSGSAAPFL